MPSPVRFAMTDRDLAIIVFAYAYRGVTAELIRRAFFAGGTSPSVCYRRLAKLIAAQYLEVATRLPVPGGVGSGKHLLVPGSSARPVLADHLDLPMRHLARLRLRTPGPALHHTAIATVRLAVELATRADGAPALVEWVHDVDLHRTPIAVGEGRDRIVFVPDSRFTLAQGGAEQSFHLEVDLGTVSKGRLVEKLRGYLLHAQTQPGPGPVPVLFATTTQRRLEHLAAWVEAQATQLHLDPTLFFLTTLPRLHPGSVLHQPIWRVPGGPEAVALLDLAGGAASGTLGAATSRSAPGRPEAPLGRSAPAPARSLPGRPPPGGEGERW